MVRSELDASSMFSGLNCTDVFGLVTGHCATPDMFGICRESLLSCGATRSNGDNTTEPPTGTSDVFTYIVGTGPDLPSICEPRHGNAAQAAASVVVYLRLPDVIHM